MLLLAHGITHQDVDALLVAAALLLGVGLLRLRRSATRPTTPGWSPQRQVTVHLANRDLFWHSFTIDHPAVNVDVPVGGARQVTFTLPPGTYRFYCRVPGHRQAGMEGTLRIG